MKKTATLRQMVERKAFDLMQQVASQDERRRRRAQREMDGLARLLVAPAETDGIEVPTGACHRAVARFCPRTGHLAGQGSDQGEQR
jgi:hypothetical protein